MTKTIYLVVVLLVVNIVSAAVVTTDTFGSGVNQFNIDFVTISGDNGNLGSWAAGSSYTFSGVNHGDYRMGTYEITNDQWNKFVSSVGGTVTGNPSTAYSTSPSPYFTGKNVPTTRVSWYEAAQFVNYLNSSTGHQMAYKFTGTQGTNDYTFSVWQSGDVGYNAENPLRNSNAKYFLPSENEWVKAAYWNGTSLQLHATKTGESLIQGDGISGIGWNYHDGEFATNPFGPWDVGSGSEELNGTFDMMGNVSEWNESFIGTHHYRGYRGSAYNSPYPNIRSSNREYSRPEFDSADQGFRVASEVPEPCSILLLSAGVLILRKRREKHYFQSIMK